MRGRRFLSSPILWIGLLFAALTLRMDALQPLLQQVFPGVEPVVYHGPYEFSVPGAADDYIPQHLAPNLVRKA